MAVNTISYPIYPLSTITEKGYITKNDTFLFLFSICTTRTERNYGRRSLTHFILTESIQKKFKFTILFIYNMYIFIGVRLSTFGATRNVAHCYMRIFSMTSRSLFCLCYSVTQLNELTKAGSAAESYLAKKFVFYSFYYLIYIIWFYKWRFLLYLLCSICIHFLCEQLTWLWSN